MSSIRPRIFIEVARIDFDGMLIEPIKCDGVESALGSVSRVEVAQSPLLGRFLLRGPLC